MAEKKYHHGDLKNALIEAGAEILSKEGVNGLSLRKVARKAGVSHAAPYAHFPDKQTLIAAISTEGYRMLYERLDAAVQRYRADPHRQLVEAAWAYVSFALSDPAHFKVTFSGVVEKEKDYPAYVEMSKKSFGLVVQIVAACQAAGVLKLGSVDATAVSVWSLVHGFASLLLEGQISHTLLDRMTIREMLIFSLNQITLVGLTPEAFPLED
jgi:AcrR family transcriptional regulator